MHRLNEGDTIICVSEESPYFLQMALVTEVNKDFFGEYEITILFQNKEILVFHFYDIPYKFKRIISECI